MEISSETDLSKSVEVCLCKILEAYKNILKSAKVPTSPNDLEDAMHPFNLKLPSESILSSCQVLLDIVHELRIRKFFLESRGDGNNENEK